MSKVYNKIVQSNTEPSKNDIWLKDGQMKTFSKEGWKSVGGGVSEEDLNKLVKGAKEVLYVELTKTQVDGSFIMSYDDYKNHIVYFTITSGGITLIAEKVFSTAKNSNGSVSYTDTYLFRNNALGSPDPFPVDTMIFTVDVSVDKNSVTLITSNNVKQIIPFSTGNGTKFLSDNGTYKTIDITSLQTQITALEKRIAALEGATA